MCACFGGQFYNDAINELVDFTEDFSRWKDTQRCSFSFCAHPFVLDPGTKSKLLQVPAPLIPAFLSLDSAHACES